jgi:hypothetical protein
MHERNYMQAYFDTCSVTLHFFAMTADFFAMTNDL